MTRQALLVARREFVERGRSKVFIGVLLVVAAAIIGGLFLVRQVGDGDTDPVRVMVAGGPPALAQDVALVLQSNGVAAELIEVISAQQAERSVVAGEADVALVDGDIIVTAGPQPQVVENSLGLAAANAQRRAIAEDLGLSQEDVAELLVPITVDVRDLDRRAPQDDTDEVLALVAFLSVLVLFMSILLFGQYVGTGVVEEKQNRVAEVILAKAPAESLVVGKVLGIGALGLIQVAIMGLATLVGLRLFPPDLPDVDLSSVGAEAVATMVVWFVLGFLLYSFFYATLGATVSRQEDLQSTAFIPTIVLLIPYFLVITGLDGDINELIVPASFVPFWAPLIMPFRSLTGDAALWEAALAGACVLATIAIMVWLGGRVYRGAALRTGAKISLREAWEGA